MMLGDLGADVIKVERPGTGDETRGWGPPFDPSGQSAYFLAINRNKLSLTLDVDEPGDRALLLELMAGADVVVDIQRNAELVTVDRQKVGALPVGIEGRSPSPRLIARPWAFHLDDIGSQIAERHRAERTGEDAR